VTAFARVLVPLDGSQRAETALRWLHLLPARTIRVLHVCAQEGPERTEAARYLEEVVARLGPPDREWETRVVVGEPGERIVGDAADVDLIVMCTQGAGGGGRLLYGSVADLVARHAPVPTLLLRGGNHPVHSVPVRRIVAPLDGSSAAERALPVAVSLARVLGAHVHLVTVLDGGDAGHGDGQSNPPPGDDASTGGEDANTTQRALEQRAAAMRASDIAATTEVRRGEIAPELLAATTSGDLLVISTHGRGTARRWQIGSVAEKLLRQADAPVVLVRADSP
jgi:nucleotide-binding universal stress UspA family protein